MAATRTKGCLTLIGGFALLILMLTLLDFSVYPKHKPKRNQCANNMRQIALAMHMYSGDNREVFPKDFISIKPYARNPELFMCPSHTRDATKTTCLAGR